MNKVKVIYSGSFLLGEATNDEELKTLLLRAAAEHPTWQVRIVYRKGASLITEKYSAVGAINKYKIGKAF